MSIPTIESYSMPTPDELPLNIAAWEVDPARVVLLIHDMQKYFLAPFQRHRSPALDLVDNVTRLRSACKQLGVPVAYTAQPGGMSEGERGLLADFWGPGMAIDPGQRAVVDPIAPSAEDRVFTKWRYSAFHRSDLAGYLGANGRDQLLICGVYAHVGVLITANDAFAHDIQSFVVADAVADFSGGHHRMALDWAAQRCSVVASTDTVLRQLGVA